MHIVKMILFLGCLAVVGLCYVATERLLKPKRRPVPELQQDQLARPESYGLTLTPVTTHAAEGFPLDAWLIERAREPAGDAVKFRRMQARMKREKQIPVPEPGEYWGTVIMLHGYSGIKEHHFAIAERFVAAGFRCLAIENRAHGRSSGKYCTYGTREAEDAQALLAEARSLREESLGPVAVFGISLGSAIAIELLNRNPDIEAGVCVSAFADLPEIVRETTNRELFPGAGALVPIFSVATKLRAGFYLGEIRPEMTAETLTQPLLMVHGEADAFTDISHGRRVYDGLQNPHSDWVTIPEGTHHNVLMTGSDPLYHVMAAFFYKNLTNLDD